MKSIGTQQESIAIAPLMTMPEVAEVLRCSQKTVRRWVRAGRLRAVLTGRCYRFRRQDVMEFVQISLTTVTTNRGRGPR
jgi:DNA binding domain, excisionase family